MDWYLDERRCLSKVEVHSLLRPHRVANEMTNCYSSTKTRENPFASLKIKTQLIFVFPSFCQIDVNQVTASTIKTISTINFYLQGRCRSSLEIHVILKYGSTIKPTLYSIHFFCFFTNLLPIYLAINS